MNPICRHCCKHCVSDIDLGACSDCARLDAVKLRRAPVKPRVIVAPAPIIGTNNPDNYFKVYAAFMERTFLFDSRSDKQVAAAWKAALVMLKDLNIGIDKARFSVWLPIKWIGDWTERCEVICSDTTALPILEEAAE